MEDFSDALNQSENTIDNPIEDTQTTITGSCPTSDDELHAWILDKLAIRVVRQPLIDGHNAPFEYLCH
ncbi:MAG: hypothetical protein JKX70_09860, partial [Phycisphaerales bacterium]|nr:hypothetical protein [Phycisphaerales bacterium]